MNAKLWLACLLIALSLGCTGNAQPGSVTSLTRSNAAKVVASSPAFQACRECNYHLILGWYQGRWGGCPSDWSACMDQNKSVASFSNVKVSQLATLEMLLRREPMIHWLYTEGYVQAVSPEQGLTLTDKGRKASQNWKSAQGGWEVPLAAKKLVEITGIKTESFMGESRRQADYTFVYSLTGLGVELFKSDGIPAMKGVGYATKSIGPGVHDGIAMPSDIVNFDPKRTYRTTAVFEHYDDGWRLEKVSVGNVQRSD